MLSMTDRTSQRQIVQPTGNVAVTSAAAANGTLASFSVPAGTMRANSQMILYADITSGGAVGTRTINVVINDGSATTVIVTTMSATAARGRFRIANRNSTSSQRCAIESVIQLTLASSPVTTATKALAGAFTISITTTNPSDTVTLESVLLEIIP